MSQKQFPLFLKLTAMSTWYEVKNDHSFTEVKTLGGFFLSLNILMILCP